VSSFFVLLMAYLTWKWHGSAVIWYFGMRVLLSFHSCSLLDQVVNSSRCQSPLGKYQLLCITRTASSWPCQPLMCYNEQRCTDCFASETSEETTLSCAPHFRTHAALTSTPSPPQALLAGADANSVHSWAVMYQHCCAHMCSGLYGVPSSNVVQVIPNQHRAHLTMQCTAALSYMLCPDF